MTNNIARDMATEIRDLEFRIRYLSDGIKTETHARRKAAMRRDIAEMEIELSRRVTEYGAEIQEHGA